MSDSGLGTGHCSHVSSLRKRPRTVPSFSQLEASSSPIPARETHKKHKMCGFEPTAPEISFQGSSSGPQRANQHQTTTHCMIFEAVMESFINTFGYIPARSSWERSYIPFLPHANEPETGQRFLHGGGSEAEDAARQEEKVLQKACGVLWLQITTPVKPYHAHTTDAQSSRPGFTIERVGPQVLEEARLWD